MYKAVLTEPLISNSDNGDGKYSVTFLKRLFPPSSEVTLLYI